MRIHHLALLALAIFLGGCTNFIGLKRDLKTYNTNAIRIEGSLSSTECADCFYVVEALDEKGTPLSFRVFDSDGSFEMPSLQAARYVFAFHDLNKNLQFDVGDPYGWAALPEQGCSQNICKNVQLAISREQRTPPFPFPYKNLLIMRNQFIEGLYFQLGNVVDVASNPAFGPDKTKLGMWEPIQFLRNAYAGVYFAEPYSPNKIPVLFVHGIGGSPRDFAKTIEMLDRKKYQPWLVYYPSGMDIPSVAGGIQGFLNRMQLQYGFEELHIVAHSMGGLVARAMLNDCEADQGCSYIRSFTSISSPFGGVAQAASGVKYAPVVMPVWRSLAPNGTFVQTLFKTPLPKHVPYHMIFGYRNTNPGSTTSGDGTIVLESQLRMAAQVQAVSLRGFNEDHTGILDSPEVGQYLNSLLDQASGKPH